MRRMRHLKPREIQGCSLALDASIPSSLYDATSGGSLVAADGEVLRWEDQSGNARHVTQSTANRKPLRRVASRGGMDTLESGSDSGAHMATASFYPSAGSNDVTIISTSFPNTSSAYSAAWYYGQNSSGRLPGYFPRYDTSRSAVDFHSSYIGRSGSPTESSNWHVHTYRAKGATTTGGTDQRVNAVAVTENYTLLTSTTLNVGAVIPFRVGATITPAAKIGSMAAFATWGSALNDAVIARVENSMMRKWRING